MSQLYRTLARDRIGPFMSADEESVSNKEISAAFDESFKPLFTQGNLLVMWEEVENLAHVNIT